MNFFLIKTSDSCYDNISEICHNAISNAAIDLELCMRGSRNLISSEKELHKIAEVGDKILVSFEGKYVPWIIINKDKEALTINSEDCLKEKAFDKETNKWKDSAIRKYLNGKYFKDKFEKEFLKLVSDDLIGTEDYTTTDKFWLLSHEEIGNKGNDSLKKNCETKHFKYFSSRVKRIKEIWNKDGEREARFWWLRSACANDCSSVGLVSDGGYISNNFAYNLYGGLSPACSIICNR